MKKFIAMLLMAAVLVPGLIGCGGDTPSKDKGKPAEKKPEEKKPS